jgi:DNA-binding transcriptional regulator YdaS (Cro superfamily)
MRDGGTSRVTPQDALNKAVEKAGGQGKLARICGCTQGAIWQMLNKAEPKLSAEFVLKVEAATGVPRWELRPDIYPPDLPASPLAAEAA